MSAKHNFSYQVVFRASLAFILLFILSSGLVISGQSSSSLERGPKPTDVDPRWKKWIGEYGDAHAPVLVLERNGKLWFHSKDTGEQEMNETSPGQFSLSSERNATRVIFRNESADALTYLQGDAGAILRRLAFGPLRQNSEASRQQIEALRKDALVASPPQESGPFRKADLVEIAPLDSTIHLDIRYATANDFLGTPVYSQARAFLQRPAADALLRVQQKLKPLGYGLLIHDAYRPWYVTKIFWDATPPEGKIFVADPAQGSRHNRGCAVDLTLYDLATGKPIEMPGTYDEMSPRSFPDYPGGTSLQRWHRDLLRRAMESEGFTVYEAEWWHFDYKDWREYPILNVPFEKLDSGSGAVLLH